MIRFKLGQFRRNNLDRCGMGEDLSGNEQIRLIDFLGSLIFYTFALQTLSWFVGGITLYLAAFYKQHPEWTLSIIQNMPSIQRFLIGTIVFDLNLYPLENEKLSYVKNIPIWAGIIRALSSLLIALVGLIVSWKAVLKRLNGEIPIENGSIALYLIHDSVWLVLYVLTIGYSFYLAVKIFYKYQALNKLH